MTRRTWTLLASAVLLLVLTVVGAALPVPYVTLGPGPTYDTLGTVAGKPIIAVAGKPVTDSKGHLNLTTVSVSDHIDLATAVRRWFDRSYAVVPREVVFPPGESEKQVDERNTADFKQSQSSAETAALRELGYPVQVVVDEVAQGGAADGTLEKGDVVTTIDGKPVTSRTKLIELIAGGRKPGDAVRVGYTRGTDTTSAPRTATLTTKPAADDANRAVIGIQVAQRQPHPFQVTFELDEVGGPSAGLMFALGLVDKIDPEDLTGGRFIAGTGEIDDEGKVGPIGGIRQKLVAARGAGATVFLTPRDNCDEALRGVPDGLRLVKVDSLDGALDALETLRDGGKNLPSCAG